MFDLTKSIYSTRGIDMAYSSDQTIESMHFTPKKDSDFYTEFLESFRKIAKHEGKQEAIKTFRQLIRERIDNCKCKHTKLELITILNMLE